MGVLSVILTDKSVLVFLFAPPPDSIGTLETIAKCSISTTYMHNRKIAECEQGSEQALEVVGTRKRKKKTGAREGDTRGEKELPRVSPSRASVLSFAHYFHPSACYAG